MGQEAKINGFERKTAGSCRPKERHGISFTHLRILTSGLFARGRRSTSIPHFI